MEIHHLKDQGVDGRIIFKWVFKIWDGRHGLDLFGSGQGQLAGYCECGNEPQGFLKCGEFLDYLRTCQLIKMDFSPWNYLVSQLVNQWFISLLFISSLFISHSDRFLPTHCRCRGLLLHLTTLNYTHTQQYSSGRAIGPSQIQHTTLTRNSLPCPRLKSNPQSQQVRCRSSVPQTAQPLGSPNMSLNFSSHSLSLTHRLNIIKLNLTPSRKKR